MLTTRILLAALVSAVLAATPAPALTPTGSTTISIANDFESRPTFYRANDFIPLDGGKYIFLGTSAKFEKRAAVHLLKTQTMVKISYLLVESISTQLGGGQVHSLIRYNSDQGTMTLIWEREEGTRKEYLIVHGRLVHGEILHREILARQEGNELLAIRPTVGHTGSGPFALAVSRQRETGRYKYEDAARVSVFSVADNGSLRQVCAFETLYRPHTLFAGDGMAFLAEYSEDSEGGAKPQGHIISLASGERRTIPVDYVIYGATFSPDGTRLYAASSMNGTLSEYETSSGTMRSRISIGTHGHVLGFSKPDTLFWIRNDGIVSIATAPALRMTDYLAFSSIRQDFWHTDGSLISGHTAWVRNGDTLWKMDF